MIPLIDGDILEYRDGGLYWLKPKRGRTVGKRVGSINGAGYRHFTYKYKIYLEHRVIWEIFNGPIPKNKQIDHINRNRSDNRIENLRLVTPQVNQRNRGARGYSWDKQKDKYKARAVHDGKCIHLGHFEKEEEARKAYDLWRKEVWDDAACGW